MIDKNRPQTYSNNKAEKPKELTLSASIPPLVNSIWPTNLKVATIAKKNKIDSR